jgi:hypothetical protein
MMGKQLGGIGWQRNKDMQAAGTIWELCTKTEKVFLRMMQKRLGGFD